MSGPDSLSENNALAENCSTGDGFIESLLECDGADDGDDQVQALLASMGPAEDEAYTSPVYISSLMAIPVASTPSPVERLLL